jgi:hypothetical protein
MKKRKVNRAKRHDPSCRNNGSCPYCRSSRTHSNLRRTPAAPGETLAPDGAYGAT